MNFQPRPTPERDLRDYLFQPPIILDWKTAAGRPLDAQVQRAWGVLYEWGEGFPSEFDCRLADLGHRLRCLHHTAPKKWMIALEREGLAELLKTQQGRKGYVRVRLHDPYAIAELRTIAPDPQRELPGFGDADTIPFDPAKRPPSARAEVVSGAEGVEKRPRSARYGDVLADENAPKRPPSARAGDVCSPSDESKRPRSARYGDVSADVAELLTALESTIGSSNVGTWFEPCRFEMDNDKCLAPSDFHAGYLKQHYAAELNAASGRALAIEVDPEPVKRPPSARAGDVSAPIIKNELTNNRTPSKGSVISSITEPTQTANDFGAAPILVAAAALYDRLGADWLYRWYAIAAACLVQSGALTPHALEAMLADDSARKRPDLELQRIAGPAWLDQKSLRRHLADVYAIEWQPHFAANRLPPQEKPARRPK